MTHPPIHIQAMPYVPGRVQGPVRRATGVDLQDAIALLKPEQLPQLQGSPPAGIVIIDGAPFAHSTLAVRCLGVPSVIAQARQVGHLFEQTRVTLDGATGIVTSDATASALSDWRKPNAPPLGEAVRTADGDAAWLLASVRNVAGVKTALFNGAGGIGLVRSEFLLPKAGHRPDSDFYVQAFSQLRQAAGPLPVVIRLLDISPDKQPDWLPVLPGIHTPIGLQGVRLFDIAPVAGVVSAQLEALENLSDQHRLGLLLPYLSRYEELLKWREPIRRQLPSLRLGAMIETPAAALDIRRWLEAVDFVAVGCNDLMQCLFGADRDQPALQAYLDPYAPVLYRLFRQMAETAGNRLDRVRLCGLLPQLPGVLPILLGLGYRIFSVDGVMIPYLAQLIEATDSRSAEQLADRVCAANQSREVRELLNSQGYAVPPP